MSRIRSIKPEFWSSEQVMECSPMARLAFIGMWNFCDDQGVHPASAKTLKAEVFPSDGITSQQVSDIIAELIGQGLLLEYSANGRNWWYVTGWRHQLINRPSAPKYPPPPPPINDYSLSTHGASSDSVRSSENLTEENIYINQSQDKHSLSTHGVLIDRVQSAECRRDVDEEKESAAAPKNPALSGGTLWFFEITSERTAIAAAQGHTDKAWIAEQTLRFANHYRASPPSPKAIDGVWLNWLRKGRAWEASKAQAQAHKAAIEPSRRSGFFAGATA